MPLQRGRVCLLVAGLLVATAGCGGVKHDQQAIRARALSLEESSQGAYLRGDFTQARDLEARAVTYYRTIDDTGALAGALNRLGNLDEHLGDVESAHAAYVEALSIARAAQHPAEQAAAESNLGALREAAGDLDEAAAHYDEAKRLASESGDKAVLATVLNNQGILARRRGDLVTARALFTQALEIDRSIDDRGGQATRLRNLGALEDAAGDAAASIRAFEDAIAIDRKRENSTAIALDLVGISEARSRLGGDLATAINERKRAQEIHRILGDASEAARDRSAIQVWCDALARGGRALAPECSTAGVSGAASAAPSNGR